MNFQDLIIGENGYFNRRLRYLKFRNKNQLNTSNMSGMLEESNIEVNVEKQKEDLEFLKYCVVNEEPNDVLTEKLNSTRELREKILKDENTDIRESFPFFFIKPQLVSIFEIRRVGNSNINLYPQLHS